MRSLPSPWPKRTLPGIGCTLSWAYPVAKIYIRSLSGPRFHTATIKLQVLMVPAHAMCLHPSLLYAVRAGRRPR